MGGMTRAHTNGTAPARALTPRAPRTAGALLLALALSLVYLAGAAQARAVRHSCANARRGQAACLAMRLVVSSPEAGPTAAAAAVQAAGGRAIRMNKPYPGFLTPQLLHAAYEMPEETAAGGTQTIAVVDAYDDPTAEADLAVYDKQFGLPECTAENGCFRKVNEEGNSAPLPAVEGGWATEISIDVQMAHATCQTCKILLVEASTQEFSDLGAGVNAAAKLGATEISNSYGAADQGEYGTSNTTAYNHPGIVVTASSGDCGYLNEAEYCRNEEPPYAEFPADSPDVVAVGGTSLVEAGGVWKSSAWDEGGSGCSVAFTAPLWQSAVANFSATRCGTGRAVADVSAIGDPETGVDVYDSTPEFTGAPVGWGVWGGTSVSSPIIAAEFGLAGGGNGVSYPASTLYAHAGHASALYDVVEGTNGVCLKATICEAAPGYDGPTGVGSPLGLEAFQVNGVPESTSPPTIAGVAEQGVKLSESHGGWTGSPTSYEYQWERCGFSGTGCAPIASATANAYTPVEADIGHALRVRETAHNAVGTGSAYAAATSPVASDVPLLSGISPSSGITGSTIVVEGSALDTTTAVTVGNVSAAFTTVSPHKLEVTVPAGEKKGKVTVTTAHGSATSKAKFTATLSVTSFTPATAPAGSSVTIKGVGFTSSSTVSFDGTPAPSVHFYSAKKLKAVVPAGAGTGTISVTNTLAPVGTVYSATPFTP